jgi:TRAP transporter TAXI family solute receptor
MFRSILRWKTFPRDGKFITFTEQERIHFLLISQGGVFQMKKRLSTAFTAVLLIAFLSGAASARTFLSIATGSTGGTYYPLGGGIAEIISKNVPEFQVTSETGNASVANINLVGSRQIEMAFAQNDIAYWASKGMDPFKERYDNLRVVASLYPEHVHCITLKGSGVNDIDRKSTRLNSSH